MNQMIVYYKETDEKVTVYDITYDKSGYPHFLIFEDGQWKRVSAKHYEPYHKNVDQYEPFGCGIHISDSIGGRLNSYEK